MLAQLANQEVDFARRGSLLGQYDGVPVILVLPSDATTLILAEDEGFTRNERSQAQAALSKIAGALRQFGYPGVKLSVSEHDRGTALRIPIALRQPNRFNQDVRLELGLSLCRKGRGPEKPTPIRLCLQARQQYGNPCSSVQLHSFSGEAPADDQGVVERSVNFLTDLRQELEASASWSPRLLNLMFPQD